MAPLSDLVARWFSAPGDFVASGRQWLEAQAEALRQLTERARLASASLPLRLVATYCRRPGNAWLALRLPSAWPRGDPGGPVDDEATAPFGDPRLTSGLLDIGNVAAGLLLEECPTWRGRIALDADEFGLVSFYRSDWSLWLGGEHNGAFAIRGAAAIELDLGRFECRFHLQGDERPFLSLPRVDCLRMLTTRGQPLDPRLLRYPHPDLQPRVQQATPLAGGATLFEPSCCPRFDLQAPLAGGIAAALVESLAANAPGVAREFAEHVAVIRGFGLPEGAGGRLGSFSQPWRRGVVGLNVACTPAGEPLLSPYCFTWLGHELGHQRHYAIDLLAAARGLRFVENPARLSPPITRYGRPLCVGTLFQVPYVHLYEWQLLMDYLEGGFAGLPWAMPEETEAVGADLEAEIREAFVLVGEYAELTELGALTLAHVRGLTDQFAGRWRRVTRRRAIGAS
ncbi:MAG: hypothetical protein U0836_04000 [Pirellulales bacterium]